MAESSPRVYLHISKIKFTISIRRLDYTEGRSNSEWRLKQRDWHLLGKPKAIEALGLRVKSSGEKRASQSDRKDYPQLRVVRPPHQITELASGC